MTLLDTIRGGREAKMDQDLPWKRNAERGEAGRARAVLLLKDPARAPAPEALAAAGIEARFDATDIADIAEGASLLGEADALVVEIAPGDARAREAFDRLVHLAAGDTSVIAVVDGLTVADTRALLRAGAADALPLPFSAEELRQALEPVRRPQRAGGGAPGAAEPSRQGRIVALMGVLGGVGTTSLATQAGILWSDSAKVCLIDFDLQFGNAALYLDLRPSLTLGDLIADYERLDPELLQSVAMRHASGLSVIANPVDINPLDMVSVEFVDRILRLAAQSYDVVLVDLPTAWTEWTIRILERADIVLMVTTLSVAGIHQARRQLEMVEANNLMPKTKILANRAQVNLFGKVDLKDSEAVLGRKIAYTVVEDAATMGSAIDEGRPIREIKSGARIAKDLKALAAALEAIPVAEGLVRS